MFIFPFVFHMQTLHRLLQLIGYIINYILRFITKVRIDAVSLGRHRYFRSLIHSHNILLLTRGWGERRGDVTRNHELKDERVKWRSYSYAFSHLFCSERARHARAHDAASQTSWRAVKTLLSMAWYTSNSNSIPYTQTHIGCQYRGFPYPVATDSLIRAVSALYAKMILINN